MYSLWFWPDSTREEVNLRGKGIAEYTLDRLEVNNDFKWCTEGLKPRIAQHTAMLRWDTHCMTSAGSFTIGDCDLVHPSWYFYRVIDKDLLFSLWLGLLPYLGFVPIIWNLLWIYITIFLKNWNIIWTQSNWIILFCELSYIYTQLEI